MERLYPSQDDEHQATEADRYEGGLIPISVDDIDFTVPPKKLTRGMVIVQLKEPRKSRDGSIHTNIVINGSWLDQNLPIIR